MAGKHILLRCMPEYLDGLYLSGRYFQTSRSLHIVILAYDLIAVL